MADKKVQLHDSAGNNLFPRISLDQIYPVGAIYLSTVSTDPGTLFGGTWSRIKDQFLLAAGDVYSAGDAGGEATHVLTTNEMPSHSHNALRHNDNGSGSAWGETSSSGKYKWESGFISSTGGGAAHNNMPPYLAVYMWQRTA